MHRPYLIVSLLIALLAGTAARAQGLVPTQPLSHDDSVIIDSYLERYEEQIALDNPKEASRFLNETGFIYWNHNFFAKAIEYYEESLSLNQKINNESGLAMLHNNLGMLHADLKNYDTSLYHFQRTLAARKAFKEKIGIISAQINLSVVYNNLGRHEEAALGLEEALSLAREMNDPVQMRSCYGLLSETYEKAGDLDKSLQYFNLYRTFHEMIQREEVADLKEVIKEEQVQKELAERKNKINQEELSRRQSQLAAIEAELSAYDSALTSATATLSKKELELRYLNQQVELEQLKVAEVQRLTELQLSEERAIRTQLMLIIGFLVVLFVVVGWFVFRIRKVNSILKKQNRQIEEQNEALAQSNALKNKLFSIVAHDLRSPLASFKDALAMMESGALSQEEQQFFMEELTKQASNTSEMVDSLLYWSKSQMGGIKANLQEISLTSLVNEILRTLDPAIKTKNLQVDCESEGSASAIADPGMMTVVIRNIISNAVKFTPKGGEIRLALQENGSAIRLGIQDSGIGMNEATRQTLLKGQRADSRRGTSNESGTGLGLMFSIDLLEANRGSLEIESEEGQGSRFIISVPKA